MAGYSGTPLWRKLGYRDGAAALVIGAPPGYRRLLSLPAAVRVRWLARRAPAMGLVHLFATRAAALSAELRRLRRQVDPSGTVWVSWPKKSSGAPTDITEDTIRQACLPLGWVDVKVCAVDRTWSGLKLMVRRSER
jgi:hypothetical protein